MATLLELLRANRDQVSKENKAGAQRNTQKAQKIVNNPIKNLFDSLPKPSDLFLRQAQKDNKKSFVPRDPKKVQTVSDSRKTVNVNSGLNPLQRGSINSFIQKKGNIADVFKSFGF